MESYKPSNFQRYSPLYKYYRSYDKLHIVELVWSRYNSQLPGSFLYMFLNWWLNQDNNRYWEHMLHSFKSYLYKLGSFQYMLHI